MTIDSARAAKIEVGKQTCVVKIFFNAVDEVGVLFVKNVIQCRVLLTWDKNDLSLASRDKI